MASFQHRAGSGVSEIALVVLEGSPMAERAAAAGVKTFAVEGALRPWRIRSVVAKAAREFQPDVVHMHGGPEFRALQPWLAWRKWLARERFKVVLQFHIWISHGKRDPLHALSLRLLDEVWCSSRPAKESIVRLLLVPERKIRVLRYGRPIERMAPEIRSREEARAALNLPKDALVVGSVSRIDKGKGSGELVHGTLSLMKENPALHLVLMGAPTDEANALEFSEKLFAEINSLPDDLGGRLHVLGNVPSSFRNLRAFDIFALPTYRECFSLALLEAQLAGLPCLATDSGGTPEIVMENQTGWLCEPESTPSFESALKRALSDRARWSEFGANASARVRREFDSERVLAETVEGYRALLAERGS